MQRFFETVIEPIFKIEKIKNIVEIGADKGLNTAKLIGYANKFGGKIYSIDPVPGFDSEKWERENPESFVMIKDLSLNVIKNINDADCFLIDGDHNWYTVYSELNEIFSTYGEKKFPLVFFHDILWPYDRRDLYYSPETIPEIYRHDYERKAILPDSAALSENGINGRLFNAKKYGGSRNGVLTAVEDFIREHSSLGLEFLTHDVLFGLGMLALKEKHSGAINYFYSSDALKGAMKVCEKERIEQAVKINTAYKKLSLFENDERKLHIGKVYPDYGEGFLEENAILNGNYNKENDCFYTEIIFDKIPDVIRFDPADASFCIVDNITVIDDFGILEPESSNGIKYAGVYFFENRDSRILYQNFHKSKRFKIKANIYPFKSIAALTFMDKLLNDNHDFTVENKRLESENSILVNENKRFESENGILVNERNCLESENRRKDTDIAELHRMIKTNEEGFDLIKGEKDKELSTAKAKLSDLNKRNDTLNKDLKSKNAELENTKAVIRSNNEAAKKFLMAGKQIGWKYAFKTALKHGFFAAKTNVAAIRMIRKNGEFDVLSYCRKYNDVFKSGMDPLVHFIWFGGYEGRNPTNKFDSKKYVTAYHDVSKSGVNPYAHYVVLGQGEGRMSFGTTAETKPSSIAASRCGGEKKAIVFDDLVDNINDFYNYSFVQPQIYPQRSEEDQSIELYMECTKKYMQDLYIDTIQDILVSVIMPTYNRSSVIGSAIESVMNQSYKKWELIIIDDGSSDGTEDIVKKYSQSDKRIVYIKNNRKKGVSGARNAGLEFAKGEYVAYLDTDNDWDDDYLLLMTNTLKAKPDYTGVYCAQTIYCSENNKMKKQYIRFGVYNHSLIKNRNYIDMNCYMHRLFLYKRYGGFSESLDRFVDWELIHRYSSYGYPYALPCILSNYYFDRADNQITRKSVKEYRDKLTAFDNETKGEDLRLKSIQNLDVNGYEFYSDKINKYQCADRNVSIIIPSYEALNCLLACIEAVKKFTAEMNYEIIIVDNNSSDIVKKYLQELEKRDSKIKVILNEHNMGFTYAVNQGIRIAMKSSDIILLNNDAIVTDGWIEELYRVKDTVRGGIIVPRQVLIPNTKTMSVHVPGCNQNRELDVSISKHHHNVVDLKKYNNYGYVKLSFAPFFLVMITRECFEKLGFLDEKNGRHYKSDRLYCQKATENDIEIIYTPFSKAYHLLQQSTAALKESDIQMYRTIFVKNDWSDIGYTSSANEEIN